MLDPVRVLGRRLLCGIRGGRVTAPRAPLLGDGVLTELAERVRRARQAGMGRRETHYRYAGDRLSSHMGRGLDCEETRLYQPGDDVRGMDWRTTARTGRPYLRVYREERQRVLHLVIDRGPSMRFGTRKRLKVAQAVRIGAALGFDAAYDQACVGATLLEPPHPVSIPSRTGASSCLTLLQTACAPCPGPVASLSDQPWTFASLVGQLGAVAPRDAQVVLISDFRYMDESDQPALEQLAARYQLHAVQVLDGAELELPDIGAARFRDTISGSAIWLQTGNPSVRERFRRWSADLRRQRRDWFVRAGTVLHESTTETDPLDLLQRINRA